MKQIEKRLNYHVLSIVIISFLTVIITSCGSKNNQNTYSDYKTLDFETVSSDSIEYQIIIDDIGYESFLMMQKPIDFYSKKYYENWNRYYVVDWNSKVQSSIYHSSRYQDVFDIYINYDYTVDYGTEVNYKLYYYFLFIESKYRLKFNTPRAINY